MLLERGNRRSQPNLTAQFREALGQLLRHEPIIDDARRAGQDRTHPADLGFGMPELRLVEQFDVDPVLPGPLEQCQHALVLFGVGGDDELAALLVGDVVVVTETNRFAHAAPAEIGFQAARLVVDAGVNDAAVVPGLVEGQRSLFFQQYNALVRLALSQLPGCRQPHDAAAYDHVVVHSMLFHRL